MTESSTNGDIVERIRQAESEAERILREAEELARRQIAEAEQEAERLLESTRKRLQAEYAEALASAEAEARDYLISSVGEAEAGARQLEEVTPERIERAVQLVVEEVRKRWQ